MDGLTRQIWNWIRERVISRMRQGPPQTYAHTHGSEERTETLLALPPRFDGPVSALDVAVIALEATKNAETLISDARILYEHGRYARAIFLAAVALEEVAKPTQITMDYLRAGGRISSKRIRRRFRSHKEKLRYAITGYWGFLDTPGDHLDRLLEQISELQRLKEACLYVDYGDRVYSPETLAPPEVMRQTAETLLKVAGYYGSHIAAAHYNVPPQRWAARLEKFRNATDWTDTQQAGRFLTRLAADIARRFGRPEDANELLRRIGDSEEEEAEVNKPEYDSHCFADPAETFSGPTGWYARVSGIVGLADEQGRLQGTPRAAVICPKHYASLPEAEKSDWKPI